MVQHQQRGYQRHSTNHRLRLETTNYMTGTPRQRATPPTINRQVTSFPTGTGANMLDTSGVLLSLLQVPHSIPIATARPANDLTTVLNID
jgi:hypothetical protein